MNRYRMFFVQTSTLPPRMHQELTKHGRFYNQNNQLPTKSHVELKDNSIGAIHGWGNTFGAKDFLHSILAFTMIFYYLINIF
jgi:hypothetical protein